jgi:hypothetical protein
LFRCFIVILFAAVAAALPASADTPTPTPGASILAARYDARARTITLDLELTQPENLLNLTVNIYDPARSILVYQYSASPDTPVILPAPRLNPNAEYQVVVLARDDNGMQRSQSALPLLMRQAPTLEPSATPSPMPAAVVQQIPPTALPMPTQIVLDTPAQPQTNLLPIGIALIAIPAILFSSLMIIARRRKRRAAAKRATIQRPAALRRPAPPIIRPLPSTIAPTVASRKPSAFISYRRRSSALLATLIAKELKARGIEVFVDTRQADGAGPFPERLLHAIGLYDIFVCLVADNTFESDWVLREVDHAHQLAKPMIPIFQESYAAPIHIPGESVAALL